MSNKYLEYSCTTKGRKLLTKGSVHRLISKKLEHLAKIAFNEPIIDTVIFDSYIIKVFMITCLDSYSISAKISATDIYIIVTELR